MSNSRGGSRAGPRCRLAFRHSCYRQAKPLKSTRIFAERAGLLKKRARPRLLLRRVPMVRTSLPGVPKQPPGVRSQVQFGEGAEERRKARRLERAPALQVRLS